MLRTARIPLLLALALGFGSAALADQQIARNGSMERGAGAGGPDNRYAEHWTMFESTVERSSEANLVPSGAGWSIKAFGGATTVGAYQDVAVTVGQNVTISAQLYTRGNDKIAGDAEAKIKLEFLDPNNAVLDSSELTVLNAASDADTWTPASIGPMAAPAGTVNARFTAVFTYTTTSSGSAYWDDCRLTINGGANQLLNGDIETPGISGQTPFGIDDWTGFNDQEKSSDVADHGEYSVKVTGTPTLQYTGVFQSTRDLVAGDQIHYQAYVLTPSTGGLTGSGRAGLKLEFDPTGGTTVPPAEENLAFDDDDPDDTWVLVTYSTTVPTDITLARIVLVANDTTADNGPVYLDDASAVRSSQGSGNQLLNDSFEAGTSVPNGLTNWTEFRSPTSQARKNAGEVPARTGSSVLKISGNGVAGVYQEVEVTPGETLTISAYARSRSTAPFGNPLASAGVKVEWRAGQVPTDIDIGAQPDSLIFAGATPDVWHKIWIDYEMPAGSAARVTLTMLIDSGDAPESATVYFDSAEAVTPNYFNGSDADRDDDEDLLDFAQLQRSFTGPGGPMKWNGIVFDVEPDDDVDVTDWNSFYPLMTGPALP